MARMTSNDGANETASRDLDYWAAVRRAREGAMRVLVKSPPRRAHWHVIRKQAEDAAMKAALAEPVSDLLNTVQAVVWATDRAVEQWAAGVA